MKNIIKLLCALAVALNIISCNEKIGPEILEAGDYITVSTYVASHTKAGYEGTSVLPDNFFISIDQNGTDKDYERTMSRVEPSNKYVFPNNEKLKWASSDYSTVNIKAITTPSIQIGNTTYGYTRSSGNMSVCPNQSTAERVEASDLLGAQTGAGIEINSSNVVVHFNHLMSKLYVKYNTPSSTTVSSVKVNNMCYGGTFDFATMGHSSAGTIGTITMYHDADNNTAEAIFFPFEPSSASQPSLTITGTYRDANNKNRNLNISCPISLDKIGGKFLPGKRYIMNVTITNTGIEGAEVTVSEWTPDITTITTPGENVLWVGTSIPAGNATLNYPAEVDRAMTCSIKNVAVGGSLVCPQLNNSWLTASHYNNYYEKNTETGEFLLDEQGNKIVSATGLSLKLMGGGLSQTKEEIRSLYRDKLYQISNNDSKWADMALAEMQSLSYESRIIPYIDAAKGGNYTTVILDHGFNDLSNMIYIAGVFATSGEHVRGYEYLRKMRDKEKSIAEFEQEIKNNENNVSLNASYIHAMAKIIDAIKKTNPNVRIIIGNYFALYSPYVARQYQVQHEREYLYTLANNGSESYKLSRNGKNPAYKQFPDYATFSNLICYYNEAIAGIYDLDIVNVYEHISIPESMFWGGTQGYTYKGKPVYDEDGTTPVDFDTAFNPIFRTDQSKFCPDGVHPSNPAAVGAIAEIYIDHLDGIVGSRGQDHPSSSSSSVNTSSILGIDSWDEEIF